MRELQEALGKALDLCDVSEIGAIVDALRFEHRLNYQQILRFAQKARPRLDPAAWDELMWMSEGGDS